MAVTKIGQIHTQLKRAIDYALNGRKTGERQGNEIVYYRSAGNCRMDYAFEDMTDTKARFRKDGKNLVLAQTIIQSFKPGEVTPEEAHRIGLELAERFLGDKYEYVIGTHLDQGHLHNHIVFNSTSLLDGKQFRNSFKDYFQGVRATSDEICRENEKSIIENPQGRGQHYKAHMDKKQGKPNMHDFVKLDIDRLIPQAYSFPMFLDLLKKEGYIIRAGNRKHISIKAPYAGAAVRLNTLKGEYTEEAIKRRIEEQKRTSRTRFDKSPHYKATSRTGFEKFKNPYRPSFQRLFFNALTPYRYRRLTLRGIRAMYYHYLYFLRECQRNKQPRKTDYYLRKESLQYDKYIKHFNFLSQRKLNSRVDLDRYLYKINSQIESLQYERYPKYRERKTTDDDKRRETLSTEIANITSTLKPLYSDRHTIHKILDSLEGIAGRMKTLKEIQRTERAVPEREIEKEKNYEHRR